MRNSFHNELAAIKASDELKQDTLAYLRKTAYTQKHRKPVRQLIAAVAAALLIIAVGITATTTYFAESMVLDIDVNPGIELRLNRFERVIGTYAYNADGQAVLDEADILHLPYKEAVEALIAKMAELGYIEGDGVFTATLQSSEGSRAYSMLDDLRLCVKSALRAAGSGATDEVFSVDAETKHLSHQQNLSPAKYLAILELQALDPTVTFENCRDHSIAEISEQTHMHMYGVAGETAAGGHEASGGEAEDSSHEGTATVHESAASNAGEGHGQSASGISSSGAASHDSSQTGSSTPASSGSHHGEVHD